MEIPGQRYCSSDIFHNSISTYFMRWQQCMGPMVLKIMFLQMSKWLIDITHRQRLSIIIFSFARWIVSKITRQISRFFCDLSYWAFWIRRFILHSWSIEKYFLCWRLRIWLTPADTAMDTVYWFLVESRNQSPEVLKLFNRPVQHVSKTCQLKKNPQIWCQ